MAAGLDLDWAHALPAQAAHMGPEASQEGGPQRLAGFNEGTSSWDMADS